MSVSQAPLSPDVEILAAQTCDAVSGGVTEVSRQHCQTHAFGMGAKFVENPLLLRHQAAALRADNR